MNRTLRLVAWLTLLLSCMFLGACSCDDTTNPGTGSDVCGNGSVEGSEACDDGNQVSGDGCSDACQNESGGTCGDGTKDTGEECDDGNTEAGDGCSATCTNEGGPNCGNGTTDTGEECDDGNQTSGDGCSSACTKEPGPECGNNEVEAGEECDDGNQVSGDGCEANCTESAEEVVCEDLAPLPQGTCEVAAGDDTKLVIGTVLTPTTIYRGGQVLVDATGHITCVGCDCDVMAAGATKITCPTGVVSPGLINTHDHITYAQNDPYNDTGERYEHRHDWRQGKNGHTKIPSTGGATGDQIRWGELRFLMGGATSTVGSGSATGILRNLDKADQEGLGQPPVDFETFPLGDSNGTQLASGCGYPGIITEADIASDDAFFPHVAEGINAFAENEFVCMSGGAGGQDLTQTQSAFIHSIGLKANDYANMAQDGTALIWSPRSNVTLYGDTAVVTLAGRLGVLIALGTDWMPTGSMNLLRELHCADGLNKDYYDGYFSDRQLWMMVTGNAAAATATDDVLGTLATGKVADISIFDGATNKDFRAIIDAEPKDVALVMRSGKILYGDAAVVSAVPNAGACDPLDVCGNAKQVCLAGDIGKSLSDLQASAGNIYPAFFCGEPMNEPSCTPTRPEAVMGSSVYSGMITAEDGDGDGIADASDNCPTIFNPIRPVDGGAQADFDSDGTGDACDVCPLDANTNMCSVIDPNDSDGDTIVNAADNCPSDANTDQADGDTDGKGDVCDACPTQPNPGPAACSVTIYDIKDGTIPVGTAVAIDNVLVTGRSTKGFFVQVKEGDADYAGSDYSGMFAYDPTNAVNVGDRVSITSATIADFFGQLQLTNITTVVTASGEAPPNPIAATTAEVTTGGTKAKQLEGVVVQVSNATVTAINLPPGMGDMAPTNEFQVEGTLKVNDYLYLVTPFPVVGDNYATLTGVLEFRNNDSKLEPRAPGDLVAGQAKLSSFGPGTSFIDVGQAGVPTFPVPLTVHLSTAAATDTFVAVSSDTPASLTVVGGGVTIPAGQTEAPVFLNGLAQAQNVTLTASLDAFSFMASVRVLGVGEQPALASLAPPSANVAPNGMVTFTVTLDIPAPTGGTNVALGVTPGNAGTLPPSVLVPENQVSATFVFTDAGVVTDSTVSATLGATTLNSSVTVIVVSGGLVINEVDYDQVGTDNNEFIEIYNGTGAPIDLANLVLYTVNGSDDSVYGTTDLAPAGTLLAGQYLVVASNTVTVPAEAKVIPFGPASNNVQNGSPDGIALVDASTNQLIDALSYEGSITVADLPGLGPTSLVEGTALATATQDSNAAAGALCRLPDGTDTDNANADWKFSGTPTPGAANVP